MQTQLSVIIKPALLSISYREGQNQEKDKIRELQRFSENRIDFFLCCTPKHKKKLTRIRIEKPEKLREYNTQTRLKSSKEQLRCKLRLERNYPDVTPRHRRETDKASLEDKDRDWIWLKKDKTEKQSLRNK